MLGLYFSGNGNTKYCVDTFVKTIDKKAVSFSIENDIWKNQLHLENEIIFGYPIYFSNVPYFVREFIKENGNLFKGKRVFIIATMGLFSGDGACCGARLFRQKEYNVIGGLHLKMPDCIADSKLLKKSSEENNQLIERAFKKIEETAKSYVEGIYIREGLKWEDHIAGLFGQRLWFIRKTNSYKNQPKINKNTCVLCSKCVQLCPMKNLKIVDGKISHKKKCTLCYRCVNQCPQKSITILGKKVIEQVYLKKAYCNKGDLA